MHRATRSFQEIILAVAHPGPAVVVTHHVPHSVGEGGVERGKVVTDGAVPPTRLSVRTDGRSVT